MPRPKKIVAAVVEEQPLDIIEIPDTFDEEVSEDEVDFVEEVTPTVEEKVVPVVEEPKPAPVKAKTVEPDPEPVVSYNVYESETLIATVKDGSPELLSYLEYNHNQLLSGIEKLRESTDNEEDLALFNIPFSDNRVYKSLKQYYLQNGLAPKPPRITSWMHYYLLKHPMMTEEEIAIEVFGPLKYSFSLA